jgi:hypothetical protein
MSGSADARAPGARIRVCLVGPSLDILGGQAVQAARLLTRLREIPSLDVDFLPVNPRLPGPLRLLQRVKLVRTVVTSVAYVSSLLARLRDYDVVHAFSASYFSYLLAPLPAMAVARLYGRRVVLNYRSGEASDHLRRSRVAVPSMRLADVIRPATWWTSSPGSASRRAPSSTSWSSRRFRTASARTRARSS